MNHKLYWKNNAEGFRLLRDFKIQKSFPVIVILEKFI